MLNELKDTGLSLVSNKYGAIDEVKFGQVEHQLRQPLFSQSEWEETIIRKYYSRTITYNNNVKIIEQTNSS